MRKTFLLISAILVLALLGLFGVYMYNFDYGVEQKLKGGQSSAFGRADHGMQLRARLLQQRVSGLTCPLILAIRNENGQPVEIKRTGLSMNLVVRDSEGSTRQFDLSQSVTVNWKCVVPPRAEKMPGSVCEFTLDIFDQVQKLKQGEYELSVLMDFDTPSGRASLSSEPVALAVPGRRDR